MRSPWENEEFARISLSNMDTNFLPGTKQEVDFLEKKLNVKPGDHILDLGCGAGRHSIEFALRGYDVTGIDISSFMLKEAKERAEKSEVKPVFLQMHLIDIENYFKDNEPFDAAICLCESGFGVLGEDSDIAFLKKVFNILKPDSMFILAGLSALRKYHRTTISASFDYIKAITHWKTPVPFDGDILYEDQRIYTPSEINMMLQWVGFRDCVVSGCEPGNFSGQQLGIDDIEMMISARKP